MSVQGSLDLEKFSGAFSRWKGPVAPDQGQAPLVGDLEGSPLVGDLVRVSWADHLLHGPPFIGVFLGTVDRWSRGMHTDVWFDVVPRMAVWHPQGRAEVIYPGNATVEPVL